MARYDVVVIGAGLGGLTAGAILARAGRNVLVIERSNSVGGAASSYKVGDLFVEGSMHETSDPRDPNDPKHDALTRAGVIDAVQWIPSGMFYEARGGPIGPQFVMPDAFDAARRFAVTREIPAEVARYFELEFAPDLPPHDSEWLRCANFIVRRQTASAARRLHAQ